MKYVLIGGIIITAIFLIVLSFIPLGIEPLTEMYFENHTELPQYIFPDQSYNYSFTVRNLEYQKMRYEYEINAFNEDGLLLYKMDSGEIILENNETATIPGNFTFNKGFEKIKIDIGIKKDDLGIVPEFKKKLWWPDPNYPTKIDIHFWIEEIKGPEIIINPN